MDTKGNLHLYKSALLCKKEIIKRLTEGNYQLTEPSSVGLYKEFSVLNCQDLKLKVPAAASGVYWIDPDGGSHGNHERTDKALTVSIVSRRVFFGFSWDSVKICLTVGNEANIAC